MTPVLPVVRVVGTGRHVGKTTLATGLIEWFARRGYLVVAVKASHHPLPADQPGKDSHRFAIAGAHRVLFSGSDGVLSRRPGAVESLLDLLAPHVGSADLAIVEGFRDEHLGSVIRLDGAGTGMASFHSMDGAHLACAPKDDVPALALAIEREFGLSAEGSPALRDRIRRAAAAHGHLCAGVVLGVRMADAARVALGLPAGCDHRRLAVTVETARCLTDAIASTTGCSVGSGQLTVVDYGNSAATFLDRGSGRAVRLVVREAARDLAPAHAPVHALERHRQALAYRVMPDDALFERHEVHVDWPADHGRDRVRCSHCGEATFASRAAVGSAAGDVCLPCASGRAYYDALPAPGPTRRLAG